MESGDSLKIKVIHLPYNVGNNVHPLSKAMRSRGIRSDCLVFSASKFGFGFDYSVLNSRRKSIIGMELGKIYWVIRILVQYNTIHFHFGSTLAGRLAPMYGKNNFKNFIKRIHNYYLDIFQQIELLLYHFFRKKIFIHYQGDDARQGSSMVGKKYSLLNGAYPEYYSAKSDQFKMKQIKRIEKYASQIYFVNPDLRKALPLRSEFVAYSHIDLTEWTYPNRNFRGEKIKIVHAPSNRALKGTEEIIKVVESVCSKNPEVEFTLVENVSHNEAKQIYASADLLIDQLLGGWYGGLSVEALALGVPVMCFLDGDDLKSVQDSLRKDIPIINVSIENLEQEIDKFLLLTEAELSDLRLKSRFFVDKWHNVELIADKIMNDYQISHQTNQ